MNIVKIAAFSDGDTGGNPAGVVLAQTMPSPSDMQRVAAEVGFSETVFAEKQDSEKSWRVRYFSPESEVPFCGHATIALGAVLTSKYGNKTYHLTLNKTAITVEGVCHDGRYMAALQSPNTHYQLLGDTDIDETLELFGYSRAQLFEAFPPAHIYGGADHYVIALKSRADLKAMKYDLDAGRDFMQKRKLVTVMFVFAETNQLFHVRNAFASGGVLEDPATGAAAAAFTGYLRDINWLDTEEIKIIQGEDMGARSLISAEFGSEAGASASIRISGATRNLD